MTSVWCAVCSSATPTGWKAKCSSPSSSSPISLGNTCPGLYRQPHIFWSGELADSIATADTAEPTALHSSERHRRRHSEEPVHPDISDLEIGNHPMRRRQILAPQIARQPVG